MPKLVHAPHEIMSMCEVMEVRGPMLTIKSWDLDDQIFKNVFAGPNPEPTLAEGSVHLMNLVVSEGLWKIEFCSPAYEMVEWEDGEQE